jgi:anti-sigma B factor antagonist
MQLTERQVGGAMILDLVGDLTSDQDAERLKDAIHSLIQQGRADVIVNLADVPYVSSTGLGRLVASYSSLVKAGGSMKLLHLNQRNHHLLLVTRLIMVFEPFDSEEEAVASFHHPDAKPL